jgi:peptide/nickel transport system permease protein
MAVASLVLIALFVLGAILAPFLTPYADQGRGEPNATDKLLPPSPAHPFGTDELGRDVLARVLFGGRISLFIGLMVPLIAVLIGLPLGALAGFLGGVVDEIIMRITDIFLAFPPLLLAIAIAAALGPSLQNAMIAIALSWWPWYARLVRTLSASLRQRPFVDAARCMGVSNLTIMRRHLIPHVAAPVLVQATLDAGSAILTAAGLSFIGLGVQPPAADWGRMVSAGRTFFLVYWWYATFPGLAIFLTTLAFNTLGDTVQALNRPREEFL